MVTSTDERAHFACVYPELLEALSIVGCAVPRSPRPPVGFVLVDAVEGDMRLTCTDFQTFVSVRIPAVRASGTLLLDHAKLCKVLKAAVKGKKRAQTRSLPVSITAELQLGPRIEVDGYSVALAAGFVSTFPVPPALPPVVADFERAAFAAAFAQAAVAASRDDTLPHLCGVQLDLSKEGLMLTATDRMRGVFVPVAARTHDLSSVTTRALVDQEVVAKVLSHCSGERLVLGWHEVSSRVLSLTCGAVSIVTSRDDEELVDLSKLVTGTPAARLVFDRLQLLEAVERAGAISRAAGASHEFVDFKLGDGAVRVVPEVKQRQAQVQAPDLPAEIDGDRSFALCFQGDLLASLLRTFADVPRVAVHSYGPRLTVLTGSDDAPDDRRAYRCIIAPVRRNGS